MPQYSTRAQTHRKKGFGFSKAKRDAIFAESAGCCVYCGWIAETIDHVIPVSYGGSDDRYNLVAACRICNFIASDKIFDDIDLKRAFILDELRRPKYQHRKRLNFCAQCGNLFRQDWQGSTRLLCADCNTADLAIKPPPKRERKEAIKRMNKALKEEEASYEV